VEPPVASSGLLDIRAEFFQLVEEGRNGEGIHGHCQGITLGGARGSPWVMPSVDEISPLPVTNS